MEGFIILEWVSVCSLIISGVIGFVSGIINRKFNAEHEKNMIELKDKLEQKMEDDRKEFERDRDKLKREFEKDLLSIKTNFEKEIYTYKARYDHKVEMMKEMFEFVGILDLAAWGVCWMSDGELHDFLKEYKEFCVELKKCVTFYNKYRPFVKKEVIKNFKLFYWQVSVFVYNVYVFWYERKFLIEKDKNPQDKYGNMDCEDIRIQYGELKDKLSKNSELIEFRDIDDIREWYTELKNKLIDSLSEQVREYLNEK